MAEAKRRLAAILAADLVGFGRLIKADEDGTIAALKECRAVFRGRIARHEGRVVDTAGDSVLAVFGSVVEAVRCAIDIQIHLDRYNADRPESSRMDYRIGVNLGDIVEEPDGAVFGEGVVVAARLESVADAGGIMISESAHMHLENRRDIVLADAGSHDVKNIDKPVRAYRVVTEGTDARVAPSAPSAPRATSDKASIAVLPFDNLSGDPEQEYFADGIAEDLITALSGMRWMSVTARNSTFSYKGKSPDVRDVGRELGVHYVLEGSVRKGGNRVRISAQLIDATDGNHVWAQRYDRELADIFDLQDEITLTIAGAIEPELAQTERERAHRKPADNLDAWDLCQRGLWHMWRLTAEDNAQAKVWFQQSIEINPYFAVAYANLSFCHFLDSVMGFGDTANDSVRQAADAAATAVAMDGKDAMAHYALGRVLTAQGEFEQGIRELQAALDLNPSFALAHYGIGLAYQLCGKSELALRACLEAARLSPHDPYMSVIESNIACAYGRLGQFEDAMRFALSSTRRPNAGFWPYVVLAMILGHVERICDAVPVMKKVMELRPDFSRAYFERVWPGTNSELLDWYFEGLYKAGLRRPDGA